MKKLFTYGTLMVKEVFNELTGRDPEYLDAELPNYKSYKLKDRSYPGLIPNKGGVQIGKIVEVSAEELEILTDYEGKEYEIVEVSVIESKKELKAITFVLKDNRHNLIIRDDWKADDDFNFQSLFSK